MAKSSETISKNIYQRIRAEINKTSSIYVNTRKVLQIRQAEFDLKDILILGAISGTDCLLTGKTGSGKTRLANMVMKGLFGQNNITNKTVTPAMQPDDFLDIDFGEMKAGKRLSQVMKPLSIISMPGVILNEANRAPGIIQNYLIPYLDKEMDIQGKNFMTGVKLHDGSQYQFRVLTINEGEEYTVQGMDKALRDRAVIEVPVDIFYQTGLDCFNMLRGFNFTESIGKNIGVFELVKKAYEIIFHATLDPEVLFFMTYLSGMSYCSRIQSNIKIKECIRFTPRLCIDSGACRYSRESPLNRNNLCGNVYSPSQRAMVNLIKVAKGAAFMSLSKEGTEEKALNVTIEDIMAVSPMVLFNKIGLNSKWIDTVHQGNRWAAIEDVIAITYRRFKNFLDNFPVNEIDSNSFSYDRVLEYAENEGDYWVMRFVDFIRP